MCDGSLGHVQLAVTAWTIACQPPLSMAFSRKEYWSGLPFPFPGDLPGSETEPGSPAWQAESLPTEPPEKPINQNELVQFLLQSLIFIPHVSTIQQIFTITNEPGLMSLVHSLNASCLDCIASKRYSKKQTQPSSTV